MRAPDQSDTEQFELTAVQNSTKKDLENGNAHSQNGNTIKNLEYRQQRHDNEPESDDDDFDHGQDEGSRALLGSQDRTRGRERIKNNGLREVWPQAKNIVIESAPILLLTTIGLLFTGKLLDEVSQWRAMREVDQLIMIIPVVLNLKGNLEMNLSARLGTAANVGELDDPQHRWTVIKGSMTLLQVQAAVVSFIAACLSLMLGTVVSRDDELVSAANSTSAAMTNLTASPSESLASHLVHASVRHVLSAHIPRRPIPKLTPSKPSERSIIDTFVMVTSTAMSAASLSSLILGFFMCTIIVLCRRFGYDPDNIAPPIASCLGDLVTLCLMGIVSTILIPHIETPLPLAVMIIVLAVASTCFISTVRNPEVKPLLSQGWTPLFGAMLISSGTGIVLDLFVSKYEDFAILAIVISGLPGSVGSIFVSRVSTALHAAALSASVLAESMFPSSPSASASAPAHTNDKIIMLTLLAITVPVEIIFLSVLHWFGWLETPFMFVALSVLFFCCAVMISLMIGYWLTHLLWSLKRDPDMYALPVHSALMDLVGQGLLVLCFEIASRLGVRIKTRTRA